MRYVEGGAPNAAHWTGPTQPPGAIEGDSWYDETANKLKVLNDAGWIEVGTHVKLDDLATPDDNTDLNASTGAHGLLPKLTGGTTQFLRADGTWAAPGGGGGGGPQIGRVAAAVSNTSNSVWQDVTGLTFAVSASTTYSFEFEVLYTTAATTTALHLSVNGPASPADLRYNVETQTTATATHHASQTAYNTVTNPATGGGATVLRARLVGTISVGGAGGTLALRFKSEINASAVNVLRGSFGKLY